MALCCGDELRVICDAFGGRIHVLLDGPQDACTLV